MKQRNHMAPRLAAVRLSRRSLLRTGCTVASGVLAAAAVTSRAGAEAKLPQNQVSYQSSPKGEKRCEACVNYEGNGSCRVVSGPISADGWCRLWNAR